jgi:hypothetical protein
LEHEVLKRAGADIPERTVVRGLDQGQDDIEGVSCLCVGAPYAFLYLAPRPTVLIGVGAKVLEVGEGQLSGGSSWHRCYESWYEA